MRQTVEKKTTANTQAGTAHYAARFSEQSISCNQYVLSKLGIDRNHCSLKIEDYVILCVPFQFGFKRSYFVASLSKQELAFFQRYVESIIGLSITFLPEGYAAPVHFFIRCTLTAAGHMKGRENVGLFVVDFKSTPDEFVLLLGSFLEHQDKLRSLYDQYGETMIHVTAETSKTLGYNMYAVATEPGDAAGRRIQIVNLSSKSIEHLEAASAPLRPPETGVAYHLFFKKYRIVAAGKVTIAGRLPQGLVRTVSRLAYTPDLVEVIDAYWLNTRMGFGQHTAAKAPQARTPQTRTPPVQTPPPQARP
jgi:hypothetical protein